MSEKKLDASDFKIQSLKDAEEYFKTVALTETQYKIFLEFINIIDEHIPIGKKALKGIGHLAIQSWQVDHKRSITGIAKASHLEAMKTLSEICDYLRIELIKSLLHSEDETDASKVSIAVDEALEHYNNKYGA